MKTSKPKGFARRRRYQCCKCFADIWEYPGNVMDKTPSLWCKKCQQERDKPKLPPRTDDEIYMKLRGKVVVARVIRERDVNTFMLGFDHIEYLIKFRDPDTGMLEYEWWTDVYRTHYDILYGRDKE